MTKLESDADLPIALDIDRRRSRSAQVYEALRAAILNAQLKPGTPISENRICRQTGVSRTPVREAIIRLTQDELIDVFPQQGSFVAPIRLKKVMEGHFVREALEVAVIRRAAASWSKAHSARLRANLGLQRAAARARDYVGFHRADEAFHFAIAEAAGLDGVGCIVQDANMHIDRVRLLASPIAGRMAEAIAEHQTIVDALDKGSASEAVAMLTRHIETVFRSITVLITTHRDFFQDKDEWLAMFSTESPRGDVMTAGAKRGR